MTAEEKKKLLKILKDLKWYPVMDDYDAGNNNGIDMAIKTIEEFQETENKQ